MRILVVSPYLPWPLNAGGNAAQFSTLKCLAQDHQYTLICPVYDAAGTASAKELQRELPEINVRAVFCGSSPRQPLPESGLLIRLGRKIIRLARRLVNPPAAPQVPPCPQKELPYYPFNPLPEPMIATVDEELSKGTDLFQAEFAEILPLGSWIPKEIPKLFVHHQVHFVYAQRSLNIHGEVGYPGYLASVMKTQEIGCLQTYQGVIIFSEDDRRALLPYLAADRLFVSPFPIPADVGMADKLPSVFDGHFLFLASEEHAPNRDALDWLTKTIWPEIRRELPSARLVVIGRWSESAQAKFAAPGLVFSGFVKDLALALRGGVMVAPLRIGSGIRVKIMVALAQGTPVVSTSVGCEGLPVRDGEELLMRDDALEFAKAAVQMVKDPELWKRVATAGMAAVSKHYSPERVRERRNEIYAALTHSSRVSQVTAKTRDVSVTSIPSKATSA